MRFGINITPEHKNPQEWAKKLWERGMKACCFPVDYRTPVKVIDEYVSAAKEYDLLIAEVGIWNSPHNPDKDKAKQAREVCLKQFELAEYIKARCCVNVSGAAGPIWYYCYEDNFSQRLYDENVRFVQELCDKVKPKYTKYTLEPMQWMVPDSPKQYAQFMKDVNRDGFAVHMDAINLIKDPYTYTHKKEVIDEAFALLGPDIRSCHLKDLKMDEGLTVVIKEVPLGEGTMEVAHYLDRINELDADMPVLIEHAPDMAAYDKALAFMKEKMNAYFTA